MPSEGNIILKNLFWRFAERCGAQGVTFLVSIILARLLDPETYGTIALITVFITILQVFVDSGLGNALIQKKNADEIDFSTVFYFNIILCVILYFLMFFAAPIIAVFYDNPELIPVIRILSLTIIISGIKNIQQAYVSRHMLFKKFFYSTLGGTISAAIVGIILAYCGFGIWALVMQHLTNTLIDTIVLWCTIDWRPTKVFSIERLKTLYSYGWKLLISSLIDTIYNDIRQLIIGKLYSASDLAFYNRGKQFPYIIVVNINKSIDSVLFPALSKSQNRVEAVKVLTQKAIKMSSFIMWPMMCGLAVIAEPMVRLILTEKWLECVPYLQVFCIIYGFYPIHTANLNAIKALGRSDIFLRLEIIKKILGLGFLLISMRFGVLVMAYSLLFTTILSTFINSYPNRKLMDYTYLEQIKDMLPSMLLAVVMSAVIMPMKFIISNTLLLIILQIFCGGVFYILGAKIIGFSSYYNIIKIIQHFFKSKHFSAAGQIKRRRE